MRPAFRALIEVSYGKAMNVARNVTGRAQKAYFNTKRTLGAANPKTEKMWDNWSKKRVQAARVEARWKAGANVVQGKTYKIRKEVAPGQKNPYYKYR